MAGKNVSIHPDQGLPFYSAIVLREFTYIAYALLFSHRLDCDKHTCYIIFFMFTLKKYFMLKKSIF